MLRYFLASIFALMVWTTVASAQDIAGYWKSIDDKTHKPRSIVLVYPYQGKYFGRIVATYNKETGQIQDTYMKPERKAAAVAGEPYYSGMDIIWDLEPNGNKFTNGKILDPENGKVYGAELWKQDGNLIVRGKILMFGRNQTWTPIQESDFPAGFKKPDVSTLVPKVPVEAK